MYLCLYIYKYIWLHGCWSLYLGNIKRHIRSVTTLCTHGDFVVRETSQPAP